MDNLDLVRVRRALISVSDKTGIAEFATRLVAQPPRNAEFARYPTGATLVADFNITSWEELGFGMGVVDEFIGPREIVA